MLADVSSDVSKASSAAWGVALNNWRRTAASTAHSSGDSGGAPGAGTNTALSTALKMAAPRPMAVLMMVAGIATSAAIGSTGAGATLGASAKAVTAVVDCGLGADGSTVVTRIARVVAAGASWRGAVTGSP